MVSNRTAMKERAKFSIRLVTSGDLDTLVDQRHRMFEDIRHRKPSEHRISDTKYRKWASEMIRKKRLVGFLAIGENGEAIGGGCVWERDTQPSPGSEPMLKSPYLMSMYTKPKHRGKGIASAIVREAMAWCKKNGYRTMLLHASEDGRPVYSKLGWKRTWEMRVDLTKIKATYNRKRR